MKRFIVFAALLAVFAVASAEETEFCKEERVKCIRRCEPLEINFDCKV